MSKNILEVCLSPNLGGLELFLFHCYEFFKQKSICKVVIEKDKKLDNYFESDDKYYLKRSKFFPWIPAWRLAKIIDANEIDIIHFHWTRDILTVVLAKLLSRKKPKIVQSRHMRMTRFKDDLYHRWLYKNIDMIHAVTDQVKQQLQKFIPKDIQPRIELVYLGVKRGNAIDIDSFKLKQKYKINNEFIIGIVGRIEEGKKQHVVIEAISKLKNANVKLFIIGDSMDAVYLSRLHGICQNNKIEDKVVFTGFTKDVDMFMDLCDVTVLATDNETFGLVVVESMAVGTPVLAVNRGGPLEIIDDMTDGVFYDGSSDDLAKKIDLLYRDRSLIEKLSSRALQKVQNKFDKTIQLEKLYSIIEEMR